MKPKQEMLETILDLEEEFKLSLETKIGVGVSGIVTLFDLILEFTGINSLPPISDHIGDWKHITAMGVCSLGAGLYLIEEGRIKMKESLVKVGKYLPKVAVGFTTLYLTLAESIMPNLLPPCTPDGYDIPAVLLSGFFSYLAIDGVIKDDERYAYQLKKHMAKVELERRSVI